MKNKMIVQGIEISYKKVNATDFLSLTDIAKFRTEEPQKVIANWMRTYNTISFLGTWEIIHNPDFKPLEFEGFKIASGENAFLLSPTKWITTTNAIGIITKAGKYDGGTWAHKDIAFKFASWLSVEFELYVIQEFQRLKAGEQKQLAWSAKRELAKINYHIHTDAVKRNSIVPALTDKQKSFVYANEADLLNVAMFGKTAAEWRAENLNEKGNIRDFASIHQLLVLANMESYNAIMINDNIPQTDRLIKLNETARQQLNVLLEADSKLLLSKGESK
ncbi:MAG: KilA-N domain-containing protein [Firmicutes bacterium]|nr:KilA-N domain-containing protein [Bacillota bacterium]